MSRSKDCEKGIRNICLQCKIPFLCAFYVKTMCFDPHKPFFPKKYGTYTRHLFYILEGGQEKKPLEKNLVIQENFRTETK